MAARGGRPAFKPTATQRRECEELVSCGMTVSAISRVFGISEPTLRLHFASELLFGLERRRAEVVKLLYRNARKGNVSAQKKLHEVTGMAAAAKGFTEPTAAEKGDEKPAPRLGKKEEAALAAKTAGDGSEWGDDLRMPATRPN